MFYIIYTHVLHFLLQTICLGLIISFFPFYVLNLITTLLPSGTQILLPLNLPPPIKDPLSSTFRIKWFFYLFKFDNIFHCFWSRIHNHWKWLIWKEKHGLLSDSWSGKPCKGTTVHHTLLEIHLKLGLNSSLKFNFET